MPDNPTKTTFQQARKAWRTHRRTCTQGCKTAEARRDFCAEGAALYRAMLNAPFEPKKAGSRD